MVRDSRLGLLILAIGLAPTVIRRSKPLARYVGDQLIRLGEFIKKDSEESDTLVAPPVAVAEPEPGVEAEVVGAEPAAVKKASKGKGAAAAEG
jgi:hypothetical protein